MNTLNRIICLCLITVTVGAKSEFRGPLPQEQKEIIQFLAQHHTDLTRTVKLTDKGYSAKTVSDHPEVVAKLKQHFAYMKKRLDSGAMVRRWDPAFAEMVDWYDQLITKVTLLDNGIEVVVEGKTPEAAEVAKNHARIVSGFVAEGHIAVQREHKAVIQK